MAGLRIFAGCRREDESFPEGCWRIGSCDLTIYALLQTAAKGNRPNFLQAAAPAMAEELYEYFVETCRSYIPHVETGSFGAHMQVKLLNDGPFTIILE